VKALVFGVDPDPSEAADATAWTPAGAAPNRLLQNLAVTPMRLIEVDDARPLRPDWVVTRPRLAGICGSDSKMALLDFGEEDTDTPWPACAPSRR
jgi:hypothetical protein